MAFEAGSVGVDEHAHRAGHADGIGQLDQDFIGYAGGYQVLGDVTGHVGGAAVHLGRVLAAEGSAAVRPLPAIGVHDDLAAGQAGIAVRAADDEFPGGVHVEGEIPVEQGGRLVGKQGLHPGEDDIFHIGADPRKHILVRGEFVVLGGQDDGMNAGGTAGLSVIFNGVLAFGIRSQVGHYLGTVVAQAGQDLQGQVRQIQRQRHVVFGVAAGVPEHHALVTGALALPAAAFHTPVDVRALLVQGGENPAGGGVEPVFGFVVADTVDDAADGGGNIDIGML